MWQDARLAKTFWIRLRQEETDTLLKCSRLRRCHDTGIKTHSLILSHIKCLLHSASINWHSKLLLLRARCGPTNSQSDWTTFNSMQHKQSSQSWDGSRLDETWKFETAKTKTWETMSRDISRQDACPVACFHQCLFAESKSYERIFLKPFSR